jgi:hypothetical protein
MSRTKVQLALAYLWESDIRCRCSFSSRCLLTFIDETQIYWRFTHDFVLLIYSEIYEKIIAQILRTAEINALIRFYIFLKREIFLTRNFCISLMEEGDRNTRSLRECELITFVNRNVVHRTKIPLRVCKCVNDLCCYRYILPCLLRKIRRYFLNSKR